MTSSGSHSGVGAPPARPPSDVSGASYLPPDWGQVLGAAADRLGNVYLLVTERGARIGQPTAIGLDPELRTRWTRRSLAMAVHADTGLVLTADGLVVWSGDRVSALRLSTADGKEQGRVGGQQPADASRHSLDLRGAMGLAADVDGSFLLVKERRLARCAPDGSGVETWPPRRGLFGKKHEKLVPFGADDDLETPTVDGLRDLPTRVYRAHVHVGADGRVYLHSGVHITAVERDGHVRWRATLAPGWYGDVAVDGHGYAYVIAGKDAPAIVRIAPDGGHVALVVDGRRPETPLREDRLLVRPDGSLLVLGDAGRMRVFAPDGSLLWRSEAARLGDEEHLQRLAAGAPDV